MLAQSYLEVAYTCYYVPNSETLAVKLASVGVTKKEICVPVIIPCNNTKSQKT